MRAAVYHRNGPAREVMRIEDVDLPEPGPGEVRVRIHVSGVNPTDWKSRAGVTPRPIPRFQIPNQDGAGVIDAVGAGVDPARMGERVWVWFAAAGQPWGTAAEWSVLPAERAVPLPDRASMELGASLGVPAMTAHCTELPVHRFRLDDIAAAHEAVEGRALGKVIIELT
jgi:NADPH2:quinone reductase